VKFWGVRGSIPTPQADNQEYGGNTCCLEIRYGSEPPLIFDAGSGIRLLGQALSKELGDVGEARIFFTHFHWDHIQGLPFFPLLYRPGMRLTFFSRLSPHRCEQILEGQMRGPYFPVPWTAVRAERHYVQIGADGIQAGSVTVRAFPVCHPNRAIGYRIEAPDGHTLVLATDHEHGTARFDAVLRKHAESAQILIYDAQYTPEEYDAKHGWGHSTWREGVNLAREAGVKRLVLFHHDPMHDDAALARIGECASAEFPNVVLAREGQVLTA